MTEKKDVKKRWKFEMIPIVAGSLTIIFGLYTNNPLSVVIGGFCLSLGVKREPIEASK